MNLFAKIFDTLFLIGTDPESQRKWRVTTSLLLLSFLLFMFWALGTMAYIGQPGFAYAADMDRRIDMKLQPLAQEQLAQRALLNVVSQQLKDSLSEGKSAEIRALALKRCREKSDVEKEDLNKEIDRKQAEFFKLVERYYRIPDCAVL
jgi:hypothetical protein